MSNGNGAASGGVLGALAWLALLVAVLAVAAAAVTGYGFQQKWWDLGFAFSTLLKYALWSAVGVSALALLITLFRLFWGPRRLLMVPVLALLLSGGLLYAMLPQILSARTIPMLSDWTGIEQVPPIHDITTDTEDPPQFDAAVRLRKQDWMTGNPSEYAGPDTAAAQLGFEGYDDIKPAYFDVPAGDVFDRALKTVREFGWLVISEDREKGIIEAAETSFWFGFTDDVVIRIRAEADGRTRLDMRSKSRIGRSDVGMNAKRIRKFMKAVQSA